MRVLFPSQMPHILPGVTRDTYTYTDTFPLEVFSHGLSSNGV